MGIMSSKNTTTTFLPAFSRLKSALVILRNKLVELFQFLPIKLKLSLIIGLVVTIVLSVFSLFVIQNQKTALQARMDRICEVLLQTLSERVKGDILDQNEDSIREAALRLKKKNITGLLKIAVVDRKGKTIVAYDEHEKPFELPRLNRLAGDKIFQIYEISDEFEYYYRIMTQSLENGVRKEFILAVAVLGIFVIASKMARQIQVLSDAARKVGYGDLDVHVSVNSKDELGELAEEFNKMTQHLREKMQMQKFVSPLTVDMIRNSVRRKGMKQKAARREVAVLFSDVRKFSTIAERLAPEDIVKLINVYFDIQALIIEKHNGIVDKFMGDQIMAIFQDEQMADNTLTAAVDIQRKIKQINQERRSKRLITLEVGIGINNGFAVLGNMGSTNRMDYTVIGDVVNVASRLCADAEAGQIITSYDLARRVDGSYPTSRLKSVVVKGRSKSIEVCEVDYDRDILT
jgi:adenylate cyclase